MAKQKNRHIGLWIISVVLLLICVHFLFVSLSVSAQIPQVLEYDRSRLSEGVTFAAYEKLPNESYSKNLAVSAELDPVTLDGSAAVRPVLINENYFSVYNIYVSGSAVTADHIANRTPAVVISDKTARSLRLDADIVGKTASLFGKDFTVVGIYKKPTGFLREISSDIYDRIYLPYTCVDNYASISVDSLAAPKGTTSEKSLPLLGMTGMNPDYYFENDLSVERDIIANLPCLLVFVLAVILTLIALRCTARIIRLTHRRLKADCQNDYVPSVLKKNWGRIMLRIHAVILLIAVPAVLFVFFPPKLVLPQNYIPMENIFDLKHYFEALKNTLQLFHTNLWCGNPYLSHLFRIAGTVCTGELMILTAAACFVYQRIKKPLLKLTERLFQ